MTSLTECDALVIVSEGGARIEFDDVMAAGAPLAGAFLAQAAVQGYLDARGPDGLHDCTPGEAETVRRLVREAFSRPALAA